MLTPSPSLSASAKGAHVRTERELRIVSPNIFPGSINAPFSYSTLPALVPLPEITTFEDEGIAFWQLPRGVSGGRRATGGAEDTQQSGKEGPERTRNTPPTPPRKRTLCVGPCPPIRVCRSPFSWLSHPPYRTFSFSNKLIAQQQHTSFTHAPIFCAL